MTETPSFDTISTTHQQIATQARQAPQMAFTTLAHHMDLEWMREAYRRTRKDGAAGIDGQTADAYAANLEENLRSLLDRAKSGRYRAPPVRRVHIPKPGSSTETRPIGIPTFEDKILQRAVTMLVEAVYEQDFLDCSYGFRPGRSAHQALEVTGRYLMQLKGGWILEIDIRKFFDTLDHGHLQHLVRQRIRDGVLLRLIGKWLKAGVMEAGQITYPEAGSPQGGVISPILSNVYLHEVLDTWFEQTVRPRLYGRAMLIRYADDAILIFEREDDAHRVLRVIAKRFEKYGLTLHPDKTRLIAFNQPSRSGPPPETFDLLGFTHYWGRSRKGYWVVKRKTAKDRFRRALKAVSVWCRKHRHLPIQEQWTTLNQKLRGHYTYYGVIGNVPSLRQFRYQVERIWRKWLERRSQRGRMAWSQYARLQRAYPLLAARRYSAP